MGIVEIKSAVIGLSTQDVAVEEMKDRKVADQFATRQSPMKIILLYNAHLRLNPVEMVWGIAKES